MRNYFFESQLPAACLAFPSLKVIKENGEKFLRGELQIIDATGKLWDTYIIEIKSSLEFPYRFPKLYEIGGAFPKIMDWHVYEEDDSCCVDVIQNELILCKQGISLMNYLNQFAVPYFANQTFRRKEGYYLYGEYSHGIFGRIEYYQNKLNAKSLAQLIVMLKFVVFGPDLSRNAKCPFCTKTRFRKCHQHPIKELKSIKDFVHFDLTTQLSPFSTDNPRYRLPIKI